MTFTWDFNTATLLAIAGQVVVVIVFMVKTANTAKSARDEAMDAKKSADGAHEKIGLMQASLALHREQVAREYVDRDVLREMEERLSGSIDRLSNRIDDALRNTKRTV